MLVGIALAFIAVAIVHNTVGEYIIHSNCATALDLLVAMWVVWPFFNKAWVKRKAFLHPLAMRYQLPIKQAFSKVRQVLSNSAYGFGDRWYVTTADTQQRRIVASLKFFDEEQHIDVFSMSHHPAMRKERLQRLLELEVQMREASLDTTLIQFDFKSTVEGTSWQACDRQIYALLGDLQAQIGPGEAINEISSEARKLVPPWWLIGLTALCLWGIGLSVQRHIVDGWQGFLSDTQPQQGGKVNE